MKYCEAVNQSRRRPTRTVKIGNVEVGSHHPVRIQSMTTSNTRDIEATIDQAVRLADAGCEIVRVTVQGIKEADACEGIKNSLIRKGYSIPLVADIHFYPPAAMRVVDFVDKVRINPGNFVDKRASFKIIEYDDASYELELLKIEEKFSPLVEKCKRLKRAMRIGVNHGSLSDRIMNRYGDTPAGMIESALEFARICRKMDYHDFVFSMKSSNPQVMIQAYRLLTSSMYSLGWDYPLHLGVTEAGEGEDGRIKSAMGIGTLLLDGIGDTIRVSLTEDPWHEIDPCSRLVRLAKDQEGKGIEPFVENHRKIDQILRRPVDYPKGISLHRNGTVCVTVSNQQIEYPDFYREIGCEGSFGKAKLKSMTVDNLVLVDDAPGNKAEDRLHELREMGVGAFSKHKAGNSFSIFKLQEALQIQKEKEQNRRFAGYPVQDDPVIVEIENESPEQWQSLLKLDPALLILAPKQNRLHYCRRFFDWLQDKKY